jgi:hypothetical protein
MIKTSFCSGVMSVAAIAGAIRSVLKKESPEDVSEVAQKRPGWPLRPNDLSAAETRGGVKHLCFSGHLWVVAAMAHGLGSVASAVGVGFIRPSARSMLRTVPACCLCSLFRMLSSVFTETLARFARIS